MMLDFKTVMVEDCCAALSDDEHRAALENMIQQFGDVMTSKETVARLRGNANVAERLTETGFVLTAGDAPSVRPLHALSA